MEYLSSKNVEYTSKDITEDDTYRDELMGLGSMGTPTLKIGETVIVGFSASKIDGALATA